MSWRCKLNREDNTIDIERDSNFIGKYYLLPKPFCPKCCSPLDPEFPHCSFCDGIENFKIARSVGLYFKWGYQTELTYIRKPQSDLLSQHILYLKNRRNYADNIKWAIPIGLAMTLCFKYKYEEMHSVDIIVPVYI